jgi:hypothetical protein
VAGEPTETLGSVLSTTTTPPGCRSIVLVLSAVSVTIARRW